MSTLASWLSVKSSFTTLPVTRGAVIEIMVASPTYDDLRQTVSMTLGLPMPNVDRMIDFMLCGSPSMLKDMCAILDDRGFSEARNSNMGEYVIERAFVEK